ncbi:hypothetical protein JCM10213_000850 [Rhodosporidiobolus nylandii]
MLLFLPVELVERIVRLAVPQGYSSATYLERQDTLRSLCLVCRDLLPLAQRVLEEMVRVNEPSTVEKVERLLEDDAKRATVRVLALDRRVIEAVKKGCASLRDVRLSRIDDFELGWLGQSRNLLHLVISGCDDVAAPYPHLPTLRSMTCIDSYVVENGGGGFLSRQNLPAVQDCAFWVDGNGHSAAFSPFFADLAPGLKTLVVVDSSVDTSALPGLATDGCSPAILVETAIGSHDILTSWPQRLSRVRYARFCPSGDPVLSPHVAAELFSSLAPLLSRESCPTILLSYLLLPTRFRLSMLPHDDLRTSVESFLTACTARNITVDFEDTDESRGGSLVSSKFAAYIAEKRAREAQAKESTGQQ